ncbi:taste receptor cell protein 1 [Castor canadensis]|uniref:taste receptor cell protein 1 n=1 Tax=Castor canadensis TaxID=51338 RepID=UPI003D16DBE2
MDKQWFPTAGILLAASLVLSASVLPLPSAQQGSSKKPSLPPGILRGTIGGVLSLDAARGQEAPEAVLLKSPLQSAPLGSTGASGRATTAPSSSVLTKSMTPRPPELQPESPVAGPAEAALAPGSLEMAAILLSSASPVRGSGQKCSKSSGLCVTVPAPASATLKTVTPRQTWQPAGAPFAPTSLASMSGPAHWLWYVLGRHPSNASTSVWFAMRPGHFRPETSTPLTLAPRSLGSPDRLPFASTANIPTVTEPLPSEAPGTSWLDRTSGALIVDSRSSTDADTSSPGPGPSGATVLLLPSAKPPPQLSSTFSSPHPPPPISLSLSLSPPPPISPSPVLTPNSSVTPGARGPLSPAMSAFAPSTEDLPLNTSSFAPALPLLMVPQPATLQGMAQPVPASPAHTAILSLQHSSSLPLSPPSFGSPRVPRSSDPTQSSALPYPGQDIFFQDSVYSTPGLGHVTHSVTFQIISEAFSATLQSPAPLKRWLLSEHIRHQLQPMYQEAFPNFKGVGVLVFGPGSATVNASLVFGGQPGPSARNILWILYRKVKASRWMLGSLTLAENSLASDGSSLTDLALETIRICFTSMRPFLPQTFLPGSEPFVLLEKQILQLVTPLVSEFYKMHPQEGPLILFSNVNQWVSVYMEYKFHNPIPTHLRGLADYLAHSIRESTLQKSSITANGEKADLALYEMWLLIPGQPFTKALEDKTSPDFQEHQQQLTTLLTMVLRPLQNFAQVVVEEVWPEPLTAKVGATFFGAMPAKALIQERVRQALSFLREAEGLWVEMFIPELSTPSSSASSQPGAHVPSYAFLNLNLLLATLILVLGQAPARPPSQKGVGKDLKLDYTAILSQDLSSTWLRQLTRGNLPPDSWDINSGLEATLGTLVPGLELDPPERKETQLGWDTDLPDISGAWGLAATENTEGP